MTTKARSVLAALICSLIAACDAHTTSFGYAARGLAALPPHRQAQPTYDGSQFETFPLDRKNDAGAVAAGFGDVWFTEYTSSQIGRVTSNGVFTEFTTPTRFSKPYDIVQGPDGNMWFTEFASGKIGRITADGSITEVHAQHFLHVYKICVGPDGALWFTGIAANGGQMVGRMTTAGQFSDFSIPAAWDITSGPDGNLWISGGNSVFRMTPTGSLTQFKTRYDAFVGDIVSGADGNLWFWFFRQNVGGVEIGRMTTAGVFKEFALGPSHVVTDITSAYGGIWFSVGTSGGGGVAEIGEHGTITEHFPSHCNQAYGLTLAADGNLWFSCYSSMDVFVK